MSGGSWWSGRGKTKAFTSDPKVVAEAETLIPSIAEYEIEDGGGWRNDEHKRPHWLRLRQLVDYTNKDRSISDDAEFWKWFQEYRDTEKIGGGRGEVSWGSYAGTSFGKTKDYLTDWWKGWGYGGSSDKTRKLALALSAVRTTVSVINNTGKRFNVQLASDNTSYTNLDEAQVVVSAAALLDSQVEEARGIRITTGYGLHEASHVELTPAVAPVLQNPTRLDPLLVSTQLLNVLEDLRIERITGEKYPGFATYFDDALEYLWEKTGGLAPKKWGPDLKHKLGTVIASAKWPDDYELIVDAAKDKELRTEFEWWKAWGDTYRNAPDPSGARQLVEDALARLRTDPNTAQELDELTKQEAEIRKQMGLGPKTLTDEEFQGLMQELRRQLGNPSGMDPCPSPGRGQQIPIKLSESQAQEIQKLLDEQMEITMSQFPDKFTGSNPEIIVTKPTETDDSRRAYRIPDRNLVQKLKSKFFFRKRIPAHDDRMLKKGEVDDEQLWRVGVDDFRVFLRRHMEEQDYVAATMLIDVSGSMHGQNVERAQMLATVMLECFSTMPHARVKVRGHTCLGDECSVYRIWEPGDPRTRLGLLGHVPSGCNYDGFAIEYCAAEMLKDQRPNETKLLIVLSDGRPNGGGNYGGRPAMQHVRAVTDHFIRKDVSIFQIAVDPHVGPEDQATMFANWIPFDKNRLPEALGKLLIRMFGASQ